MTEFDLIVIGGGAGNKVASAATTEDLDVALVEKGPLGGACLTRGCDPSKTLIHRADIVEQIRRSEAFGIDAELTGIDFASIVEESNEPFDAKAAEMEERMRDDGNLTLYKTEGRFVDERTLRVDDERITGRKVLVAAGTRPAIPSSIDGIDEVEYSTSTEALRWSERPERLVIIGGGYIAAELGYLYGSLGTDVTIVGRSDALLSREDVDVRRTFTEAFERRYDVRTGHEATAVSQSDGEFTVRAETDDGDEIEVSGDELLVATGRTPNSDILDVGKAGIETDEDGRVKANEYLETTAENVWALGDIVGNYQFRHSATHEAQYAVRNAIGGQRRAVDYPGMSHAIFTSPQIASTGRTEQEVDESDRAYEIGKKAYSDVAMGTAIKERDGFVKVIADSNGEDVLGCHIIGPDASTLIHEVTVALASGSGTVSDVTDAIHIHPALNEVVQAAFNDV